jgi:hypothetical protein
VPGDRVYLVPHLQAPARPAASTNKRRNISAYICAVHRSTPEASGNWLLLAVPISLRDEIGGLWPGKTRLTLLLQGQPRPSNLRLSRGGGAAASSSEQQTP